MTVARLVRCTGCGRHKPEDDFAGERCQACSSPAVPGHTAPGRGASAATSSLGQRGAGWPEPATPALAGLVQAGRASWHQCDGADAHPDHRETHRRGFWTEGHRVVAFIERFCAYPRGPLVGQMVGAAGGMIPWQREAVLQIFTLRDDGHRRFRRVLIGVAKKNNKTGLVGWIALYILTDNLQPTGQIVCAAASEEQADEVFGFSKGTCEASPTLRELTGGDGRSSTRFEGEIQLPGTDQKALKRLAVGGGKLDGRDIIFAAEDELHEWRTPKSQETHTVLNRGTILQPDSIVLMTTTAGFDPETIEGELYEHGRRVNAGEVDDATFLCIWYEAPDLCRGGYAGTGPYEGKKGDPIDWRSREGFAAANPSDGYTVSYERFLEDVFDPRMTEPISRRYHFNQHTDQEDIWLPAPWSAFTAKEPFRIDPKLRTVASIDAATSVDSTAITWWDVRPSPEGIRVRSRSRVWERPVNPATGQPVDHWSLPQTEVKAHLYSMHFGTAVADWWQEDGACSCCAEVFEPMHFESIGFDRSRITMQTDEWEADGLPMVEIPQTGQRMVIGFQTWFTLMKEWRFEHDGNTTVARHVRNSAVRWASDGGRRLMRKESSVRRPNDAAVTEVMNGYLVAAPPAPAKKKGRRAPTATLHV